MNAAGDPSATRRSRLAARLRVGEWFAVASAALVLLVLGAALAGALALSRLSDARHLVVFRLDPAQIEVLRLSSALVNQETGVRGYALAGQSQFLAPYTAGRADEQRSTVRLQSLVRDLSRRRLEGDLAAVRAAATGWQRAYAAPTIATVRASGPVATPKAARAGKQRFDQIRAATRQLARDVAAARRLGVHQHNDAAHTLTLTLAIGGLIVLLGAGVVLVWLRAVVTRPLGRLSGASRRAAQGAYDDEIALAGARDIIDLGHDVDAMRRRIVDDLQVVSDGRAQLDAQARELERSNAELEQFAYVASHDLQEPLRKIAGFTQLLQQRYSGQLDERADQYIDFAVDGARRMQALINDLLTFSRVGRLDGTAREVDCDAALAQALSALSEVIEESGAEIEAGPLPTVQGEPALLTAVFQNLVSNAVKFRRDGAVPHVRIGAERDGALWRFTCSDDGIGIEPQYAERVFMIFQRLHARNEYAGSGIGLALCRKIVEHHGGTMWLEPSAHGATFQFTLPVTES